MFSLAMLKFIGIGAGVLALIALLWIINGWRVDAAERKAKLDAICTATREASANPKLACKDVPLQIAHLGKAIADLKAGIAHQNAAVNALAAESARQKAAATEASRIARERARGPQAASQRLAASSRSAPAQLAPAGQCEPSPVMKEQWL